MGRISTFADLAMELCQPYGSLRPPERTALTEEETFWALTGEDPTLLKPGKLVTARVMWVKQHTAGLVTDNGAHAALPRHRQRCACCTAPCRRWPAPGGRTASGPPVALFKESRAPLHGPYARPPPLLLPAVPLCTPSLGLTKRANTTSAGPMFLSGHEPWSHGQDRVSAAGHASVTCISKTECLQQGMHE